MDGVDISNHAHRPDLTPQLFDGATLPFDDQSYDLACLLTVLHHVPADQHTALIRECLRVAPRLVVIEDLIHGDLHRKLTHWADSLMNLEFQGHPHANRSEEGWLGLFESLGYRVEVGPLRRIAGIFEQRVYTVHADS